MAFLDYLLPTVMFFGLASIFSDVTNVLKAQAGLAPDKDAFYCAYIQYMHTFITFAGTALTALVCLPDYRQDQPSDDANNESAAEAAAVTPTSPCRRTHIFFDSSDEENTSDDDETQSTCSEDTTTTSSSNSSSIPDDEQRGVEGGGAAMTSTWVTAVCENGSVTTITTTTTTTTSTAAADPADPLPNVFVRGKYDARTGRLFVEPNSLINLDSIADGFANVCSAVAEAIGQATTSRDTPTPTTISSNPNPNPDSNAVPDNTVPDNTSSETTTSETATSDNNATPFATPAVMTSETAFDLREHQVSRSDALNYSLSSRVVSEGQEAETAAVPAIVQATVHAAVPALEAHSGHPVSIPAPAVLPPYIFVLDP